MTTDATEGAGTCTVFLVDDHAVFRSGVRAELAGENGLRIAREDLRQIFKRGAFQGLQHAVDDLQRFIFAPARRRHTMEQGKPLHVAGRCGEAVAGDNQRNTSARHQARRGCIVRNDEIRRGCCENAVPCLKQIPQAVFVSQSC